MRVRVTGSPMLAIPGRDRRLPLAVVAGAGRHDSIATVRGPARTARPSRA